MNFLHVQACTTFVKCKVCLYVYSVITSDRLLSVSYCGVVWKFPVLTSSHFLVCNVNSVHCVFHFFSFCVSLLLYPFAPSFIFSILSVFPSVLPPLWLLPLLCVSGRWGLILLLLIFPPGPSSGGEVCVCRSLLYCHSQTGQGAFFPIKLIYCRFFFSLNFLSFLCKRLWKHNGGFHSKLTALTGWFWVLCCWGRRRLPWCDLLVLSS